MDFASLPPEINSARMYTGAGAQPLIEAATAWENLATELAQTASDHTSTVTALAAAWIGPSASAMTASAMTFTSWLTSSAAAAAETANQALSASAAYEMAFAATVPPPLIETNRLQLAVLVATNFLGVNTAAIMATEAAYAEMWAQDVTAMSTYQAQSAAATAALPQLTQAPRVTNPTQNATTAATTTGTSAQTILNWLLGQLSTWGQSFLSSGPYEVPISLLSLFTVLWGVSGNGALGQAITNRITNGGAFLLPEITIPTTPITTPGTTPAIRAGIADGERIGGLRVPPSWAQQREGSAFGNDRTSVAPIDRPESPGLAGIAGMGGLAGLAGMRGTPQRQKQSVPHYGTASTVMPRHPFGG